MEDYVVEEVLISELYDELLYNNGEAFADEKQVSVEGWIKTNRDNGSIGFIELSDGTCFKSCQLVYNKENLENYDQVGKFLTGCGISAKGKVVLTPEAKQPFEIQCVEITLLAPCDESYPLQKKRHSLEYLREIPHLRARTNTFQAVMRIRSVLSMAVHEFYQSQGFVYVHAPIITANDAEGAGEAFIVTTRDDGTPFPMEADIPTPYDPLAVYLVEERGSLGAEPDIAQMVLGEDNELHRVGETHNELPLIESKVNNHESRIDSLDTEVDEQRTAINNLTQSVSAETAARQAMDTQLRGLINGVSAAVSTETVDRTAKDTVLQEEIDAIQEAGYLTDAPSDGKQYVRQNGSWSEVTGGGSVGSANVFANWNPPIYVDSGPLDFTHRVEDDWEHANEDCTYICTQDCWAEFILTYNFYNGDTGHTIKLYLGVNNLEIARQGEFVPATSQAHEHHTFGPILLRKGDVISLRSSRDEDASVQDMSSLWMIKVHSLIGGGGGPSGPEIDPIWTADKPSYYTKEELDRILELRPQFLEKTVTWTESGINLLFRLKGNTVGKIYGQATSVDGFYPPESIPEAYYEEDDWTEYERTVPDNGSIFVEFTDESMLFTPTNLIYRELFETPSDSFPDAPVDGKIYGRRNNDWTEVKGGEGYASFIPDYTQIETLNRITEDGGSWIADRDGFVLINVSGFLNEETSLPAMFTVTINAMFIASIVISDWKQEQSTVFAVGKGDHISIDTVNTGFYTCACYYIPPKSVTVLPDFAVEEAPEDGKLYARKDGNWNEIPTGTSLTKWVQKETGDGSKTNFPLIKGTAMFVQGVRVKHTDDSISILWQEDDYTLESDNSITLTNALGNGDVAGFEYVGRV